MTLDRIHDGMAVDGEEVTREQDLVMEAFWGGADLPVYDCQYAGVEFTTRIGWGYASFE